MHHRIRLALLLVITAALGGCDESASAPPAMVESLPLAVGDQRIYRVQQGAAEFRVLEAVTGPGAIDPTRSFVVRRGIPGTSLVRLPAPLETGRDGDGIIKSVVLENSPEGNRAYSEELIEYTSAGT